METIQKPKINFYVKRSFGEKMNATFDFIKENWKPLLKYGTYVILPLCLWQSFITNRVMGIYTSLISVFDGMNPEGFAAANLLFILPQYLLMLLTVFIGSMLLSSILYALMQLYNQRPDGLKGIVFSDIKPFFIKNMGKFLIFSLIMFLFTTVAMAVVGLLAVATYYSLIITIPALIALFIAMSLIFPVYVFENTTISQAFIKGVRLGFSTWGGVFLVLLIMGIISNILSGVLMLPWYVATMMKFMFALSELEVGISNGYNILIYLLGIVSAYGGYIAMNFTLIGVNYQYAHASEVVDSISVETDIDNFEQL